MPRERIRPTDLIQDKDTKQWDLVDPSWCILTWGNTLPHIIRPLNGGQS